MNDFWWGAHSQFSHHLVLPPGERFDELTLSVAVQDVSSSDSECSSSRAAKDSCWSSLMGIWWSRSPPQWRTASLHGYDTWRDVDYLDYFSSSLDVLAQWWFVWQVSKDRSSTGTVASSFVWDRCRACDRGCSENYDAVNDVADKMCFARFTFSWFEVCWSLYIHDLTFISQETSARTRIDVSHPPECHPNKTIIRKGLEWYWFI